MKNVDELRVPVTELAERLGIEASPELFAFLVRRIGIEEIRLDDADLVHMSYLPVEQLLRETMEDIERSKARPVPCRSCARYLDAEHDDGIFADPVQLEGFFCRECAQRMNAWDYFHRYLKL